MDGGDEGLQAVEETVNRVTQGVTGITVPLMVFDPEADGIMMLVELQGRARISTLIEAIEQALSGHGQAEIHVTTYATLSESSRPVRSPLQQLAAQARHA
jgi:hypothetical protein